ncbi:tetratricopeptide repeat protein [Novosphingobium flavum]|uniref:Tetratricopeptide repeat protein n=1 Tax=Novosphingobium flavum TaxID=1778672 RepID=A0A7X1KKS5_9SPHN|nr:tetratricopeptide repeat protein [Novosphingobium flavum]MBC2664856.1 tetratricopeptide repeat protein [Novosphingobium flavum]
MTWVAVIALALVIFAVIAFVFRVPRVTWEVVGAALLLGLAGYALQGSPGARSAPKAPAEQVSGGSAEDIAARQKLADGAGMGDKNLIIADALARHGQFADAAAVLRIATDKDPKNGEAWLTMANALVGHAEGTISPAAIYAYGRASEASPDSAGPPFFLGLALIRSGRFDEGRKLWADLLARSPKEAPWRGDLEKRLGELDAFLARQGQGAAQMAQ